MIPTKDELIAIVCDRLGMFSNDAVEDLADELIRRWNVSQNSGNAIVSGSLPDDSELEDWLFDGYERNEKNLERLKIGRVVRDRIAQKLNSGNDR